MDECKPLPPRRSNSVAGTVNSAMTPGVDACRAAAYQGLTLVHFSAQRKLFLWDRGCDLGLFRGVFTGCQGVVAGVQGVFCLRHGSG